LPDPLRRPNIHQGAWGSALKARGIIWLAAALFAAFAGLAAAQSVVQGAERSTVRVAVIVEGPSGRMLYGTGSGFVVAPNLVVTNAHVVAAARQQPSFGVAVIPPEGEGLLTARIVQYSPLADLALLEFRGGPDLPPVTLSVLEPKPGDPVVALGFPDIDDLERPAEDLVRPTPPSLTSGTIASLRDRAPNGDPIPSINHAAVISSGSSGGPLLDECGRVIGVNTWHSRARDTAESRSVASRTSQLIDFLRDAGVTPLVTEERCLSFTERAEAERAATVGALEAQNRELAAKLETADRLTRIAVVILIGGTLALFVAVGVLGGLLLSRRPHHPPENTYEITATPRRGMGVVAVVGGAAVAAIIVVGAGVALLRARAFDLPGPPTRFQGEMSCTLDRLASRGAGEDDATMSFSVSGEMCVNGRTLYAAARDGQRYQRAILTGGERALDVLSIDPHSGEFRRERFGLSESAFAAADQAVGASAAEGCDTAEAREGVARRNETLLRFAEGRPTQRLIYRCEAAGAASE
jgi:serine protease Do